MYLADFLTQYRWDAAVFFAMFMRVIPINSIVFEIIHHQWVALLAVLGISF